MRNRLLPLSFCCALLLPASALLADDSNPGAADTAKLKITFTVPKRIEAAAHVSKNDLYDSGCLVTRDAAAIAVNAVVRNADDWRLTPVTQRARQSTSDLQDCDSDLSVPFDIDANWYNADGVVTLLVSPL